MKSAMFEMSSGVIRLRVKECRTDSVTVLDLDIRSIRRWDNMRLSCNGMTGKELQHNTLWYLWKLKNRIWNHLTTLCNFQAVATSWIFSVPKSPPKKDQLYCTISAKALQSSPVFRELLPGEQRNVDLSDARGGACPLLEAAIFSKICQDKIPRTKSKFDW